MKDIHFYGRLNQLIGSLKERYKEKDIQKLLLNLLLLRLASLEYWKQDNIYFPPNLKWEELKKQRKDDLRENIYHAMCILNKTGSKYRGLLDPDGVSGDFDDEEIYMTFEIIDKLSLGTSEEDYSDLIEFFEFVLKYAVSDTSKQMGEYYTPRQVSELIVKLLNPEGGSIYDPCCGSGSILVCAANYMRRRDKSFQIYGQEVSENAWKIARMNLMLGGLDADLGAAPADIAKQDVHADLRADYVLGNPPFHGYVWNQEQINEKRWKYGIPSVKRGDFAWMQHMLYHLSEEGKMGAIFSNGILASRRADECRIRAALLQEDILEAIITLPAGIFYNTKVSASLWILCKNKKSICKDKILLVDARKLEETTEGKYVILSDSVQEKIIQVYENYQNGITDAQMGFCRQISAAEIDTENYSLAPERYMISEQQALPGLDELEMRERKLKIRLMELMDENHKTLDCILKGK